jgi:D-glycero-D-manno-heptose 1,7-bisphosphate phosphatase
MGVVTRLSPAALIDRDGTVIRDVGYLRRVEEIELLPRAADAIGLLGRHGLKVVIVTNQSAVARGLLTESELAAIHRELSRQLAASGAPLDGLYHCPHHPTEGWGPHRRVCECRKPNVGLAKRAAAELKLDLARCYVVGDQPSDMEFAARIPARGFLIQSDAAREGLDVGIGRFSLVKDLWEAAELIIKDVERKES